MCQEHEFSYFVNKARIQIDNAEFLKSSSKTVKDEFDQLINVKDIFNEMTEIKNMKQKEIAHFENKIFTIDRQIDKFRNDNKRVIYRYESSLEVSKKYEEQLCDLLNIIKVMRKCRWLITLINKIQKCVYRISHI